MGELLDFLFISILIFYILRAVLRFLVPVLFENAVNKVHQQQQQQQYHSTTSNQQQNYNRTDAAPGNIKVDFVPPHPKKKGSVPDSEGEFVDYEEVK